ncbi:Outer membrane protein beta-barrel domain-containing protein [Parapedobacter indicus]|uniref:Outer membrane protein beta-barrel domain-containing protein n=2 Tax=Parapedobacter indicus TaxID=1477437 RepID=A0A1I3F811_9SPHI|nr:outer membrane protein with beta-barrel domain [Parapedobacter indicus]SFI07347.1 Outer membrane protein beta-barrel domain-containing protein [Parapedobacter indicus]
MTYIKRIYTDILDSMQNNTLRFFLFIVLSSFITFPQQGMAQDYYSSTYQYKPMSFGITFAPNMGWMRYGDTEGHKSTPKFGFAYGLLADFAFTENYYFSTGLLVNTLNNEAEYPSPVADPTSSVAVSLVSNEYRLQYAEIPISLKLKSTMRYFRSYYGQFGFTGGIKLNAKEKADGASSRTSLGNDADFFRLALQIGGGVEWQLDHNMVMMTGLSFNNGFTRVIKQGEPRNSYVAFNFGIFF